MSPRLKKSGLDESYFGITIQDVRLNMLTWAGIVGSAITLFSGLKEFLNLADWARWLVVRWHDWAHAFWAWIFSWVKLTVPRELTPVLTFAAFTLMLLIGAKMSTKMMRKHTEGKGNGYKTNYRDHVTKFIICIGFFIIWVPANILAGKILKNVLPYSGYPFIFLPLIVFGPMFFTSYMSKERIQCFILSIFYSVFCVILAIAPLVAMQSPNSLPSIIIIISAPVAVMAFAFFAPLRIINKRFMFLAIGLGLLLTMNEIAKLDVHHYLQTPHLPK